MTRTITHLILAAAVHTRAAGEHEGLNAVKASKLEETGGGFHVGVNVNEGVLDGRAHARPRGHVHDPLDAFGLKNARDERSITQVPLEKADAVGAVLAEEHGDIGALGADIVIVVNLYREKQKGRKQTKTHTNQNEIALW